MNNNNFEISSQWIECKTSTPQLFEFLSNIKNLQSILPKDKVHHIEYPDDKHLRFSIENIITLTLHISNTATYNSENPSQPYLVEYTSEPFGNYHLILKAELIPQKSKIILTGHLNPFVLSIAKNKLTHLVNRINQELSQLTL